MPEYSEADIRKLVEENGVKLMRSQFTDIFGFLKNVAITDRQLDKVLNNEIIFDSSFILGSVRIEESDMYLRPNLDGFIISPWRPQQGKVAGLICGVYRPDGTPFERNPRGTLKKVLKEVVNLGYSMNVGPECEFSLLDIDECGDPKLKTQDNAGYFDLGPLDAGENVRRGISLALENMGFEIEASHHEAVTGQNKISFKYENTLVTADNIMTSKLVIKTVAQRHSIHATFVPEPFFGINGSRICVNMSLNRDGKNAFVDEDDELGLSKIAYNFTAGLIKNIKGISATTNPLINSYKKLVPGYEAPVYIAWSAKNGDPSIGVPAAGGNDTRIRLRYPDPSASPYLVLTCLLSAGLDGIKDNLVPPERVEKNIFKMTLEERGLDRIDSLPGSLEETIKYIEESELVKETLGSHIFNNYIKAKRNEWDDYRGKVHK